MSIWIPVLSLAFVSIMNLLRGKLTYCAYEKKTNEPAHGKLLLITKINNEDLSETVHLCLLISVIEYAIRCELWQLNFLLSVLLFVMRTKRHNDCLFLAQW